jgi:NDP-sugar pyrophosphorylase family protein
VVVEGMILAAGEGRRLRPITEHTPKALVDVVGTTALERVAAALTTAGVDHLIVNAHHFADEVETAALELVRPGLRVTVSREDRASETPLETGGGLAFARESFERQTPFFLHNADVLTDLDLAAVYASHLQGTASDGRLATLVVTRRETSRPLRVDDYGVFARMNLRQGWEVVSRHPVGNTREVGFSGIQVLSPGILRHFAATGAYSIIDVYMELVAAGEVIACYDATDSRWYDIGTPARLAAARQAFEGEATE